MGTIFIVWGIILFFIGLIAWKNYRNSNRDTVSSDNRYISRKP